MAAVQNDRARPLRLGLPKGRLEAGVTALLEDAGLQLSAGARSYRPVLSLDDCEVKLQKPQNIVEMLHLGSRDAGFVGLDWIRELHAEVIELIDTGLDPVRLVVAAPAELARVLADGRAVERTLVVASEYVHLTEQWIGERGLDARCLRSYGATEVFPPEDADLIVDNTSTGATLVANGLVIVDELLLSSTRLVASPQAMDDDRLREGVDRLALLVQSVLAARERVILDLNVSAADLDRVIEILPCLREPTVSPLSGNAGFAVRGAVLRTELPRVIHEVKARGGTDLVVSSPAQILS